jgi:hypothetical protein
VSGASGQATPVAASGANGSAANTFAAACVVRPLGDGTFTADLPSEWTIGQRPHGGFLLALLAKAASSVVSTAGAQDADPLAVSTQFLRAPEVGPVLLRTELRKLGQTAAVVSANIEQRGRSCVESTITVGRLPEEPAAWTDLPDMPAKPPVDAVDLASVPGASAFRLSHTCEVRLDQTNAGFLHGKVGDRLHLRLWARPKGAQPDPLFALVAGDISMPVTLNLGRYGWSPTVQLTALLRSRPAPGWLRVDVRCRSVFGQWFDEDATVIDSAGRLVCQARQLALTPQER